ncbi:hypothetical protein [Actinomadura meyerae]|uniref:hypothetical protein n=1 Tax=Actinomadura meyerae TaxID=240840 RepID=UPI0011777C87|nr:hypothetical protein [Actinomadura meyerae]
MSVGKASRAGEADPAWLERVRRRAAVRGAITVFAGVWTGADPTGAMSRGHTEIAELSRRIVRDTATS